MQQETRVVTGIVALEDSVSVVIVNCQHRRCWFFADFGEGVVASPYGGRHDGAVGNRTPRRHPGDNDPPYGHTSSIESMLYCALSAPNEPVRQLPDDRLGSLPDNHGGPVAHKGKFVFLVLGQQQ